MWERDKQEQEVKATQPGQDRDQSSPYPGKRARILGMISAAKTGMAER